MGNTVLSIPFTFIAIAAALNSYDWQPDQAALSLGASRFQKPSWVKCRKSCGSPD
ncbi:binding-protein-dependent transport systems inner membrane component domain protein [Brucella thiophenivorans]|uniref:Binding-protein-dependent transport systems inner membrane component domain protein n=1 Tax=Brucella thiophenivorans TaxID=571255 RepID=A0A256FLY2_9HYPH|nr:binding-protein-dependent transport systems inner membrane component domain protein [Brucella thiophenivorans]